jgi:hypothetical protein
MRAGLDPENVPFMGDLVDVLEPFTLESVAGLVAIAQAEMLELPP